MSDYKRNPRGARRARKSLSRKALVVLSLMMVLVMAAVGGTVAWLTDSTGDVTNTFTVGDVDIDLTETFNKDTDDDGENDVWQGKMVPGATLSKDPVVSVTTDSEDCWVFVKVTEGNNLSNFISYSVATGWTKLDGENGVWYRKVLATDTTRSFSVLTDNKVTVKEEVTKGDLDALTDSTLPTLTFKAYAVQLANGDSEFTAAQAWAKVTP